MKRLFPFVFFIILMFGCLLAAGKGSDLSMALRGLAERADSGDAKALYDLARLYDKGYDSIPVDSVRSTALYLKSAEAGYAPARNYIGFRYYLGESLKQDVDSALYWIRLAAEDGDITAATNLGYLLTEGEGINHEEEEALDWLAIAADAGVPPAQEKMVALAEKLQTPKALALLGEAYSKGWGVSYDYQKSIDYFHQGALAGNPAAQFTIAEMLDIFPDAFENESADYWYEKAAEAGVIDAESAHRYLLSIK